MPRRLMPACAVAALLVALAAPIRAACPSDEEVARLAEALAAGRLAEPTPGLSLADAECAREKLVPLLERRWGRVVGYKAGPDQRRGAAALRPRRAGARQRFRDVRLGRGRRRGAGPLRRRGDPERRARPAGARARRGHQHGGARPCRHPPPPRPGDPFIELPGAGFRGTVDGPNLVVANVNARLGVAGRPLAPEATEEFARRLGAMTVVFADDTREIARAPGTALLGHPLDVIPWLVADLAKHGQQLRAGDIVSLGGFAPSVPAQPGRSYAVRYEGLLDQPVSVGVRVR